MASPPPTNSTATSPTITNSTSSPPPPPLSSSTTNGTVSAPPNPPPPNGLPPGVLVVLIVGVVIGAVIVMVVVGIFVIYRRKKRKLKLKLVSPYEHKSNNGSMLPKPISPPGIASNISTSSIGSDKHFLPPSSPGIALGHLQSTFTYEELKMSTHNFSHDNLLGQGGFGYVHKGILPNGREVAIKQLKDGSKQGEREFQAEIEIISRVHHRHLVSLVGYCICGARRLLVYEFVPNKTLEFHLHGKGRPVMDWPTRMKIALGSAKGLAYLHEDCQPKIIHRDIKAANILIDNSFEAKVADFGLAKFSLDTDTHVSTRVMGTFGYLAPEYASSGKLTEKSDIFSFGVLLLELITGLRPFDKAHASLDDSMVDWVKPLLTQALEDGNFDAFVDPKLEEYDSSEMTRMVACAATCVRQSARSRPQMSQIVRALEGNMPLEDLTKGVIPGQSAVYHSYGGSSNYNTNEYKDDVKKFRRMALERLELGSSEFSALNSESSQNPSSTGTNINS